MEEPKDNRLVPTENELKDININDPHVQELVVQARQSAEADGRLTIWRALVKYKKAVFWAMFLSTSLIMEGYDVVIVRSPNAPHRPLFTDEPIDYFFLRPDTIHQQIRCAGSEIRGQDYHARMAIRPDQFGSGWSDAWTDHQRLLPRPLWVPAHLYLLPWVESAAIFIVFFAPSLSVLAFGEFMCGISWGVFQTLSTAYACEVVPTILRPYVTAYVCMCWGAGILLSSGVVRAVVDLEGDLGWRLPFALQWVWPVPLMIGAYFAPASPWNAVRRNKMDLAKKSLDRLAADDTDDKAREVEATLSYIRYTTELEKAETASATYLDCFRGTNLRRTEINCVVWAAQILCGNAILGYAVVFLQSAGFSEVQSFNLNISLSACYIVGGIICWLLFPHFGRATIYMSGMAFMFVCLVVIGGLGFVTGRGAQLAIGVLLVISTLCNMITIGPACYPIVAETPSGRLRYKTIVIGRFTYNLTGIFNNSVTPRMISSVSWNWGAKAALFYAGTNILCNIWCWFRLPETKDRSFGEIDLLFDNRVPARRFKHTNVDQFNQNNNASEKVEEVGEVIHISKI
ncbi:unnamed protein product [Clonostachys byssicola]|uniref:Major facilitator superfamily (MFS) profile domain-containing protein n=1 Tax=Clonostachys byssicola TaxID=160290 RepID=A0A9N9UVZ2_9HYPO|nr:unnamed protein product [Clonostachys byssicola]